MRSAGSTSSSRTSRPFRPATGIVGSGLATFRGDGGIYEGDGIADFHHASQVPGSLDRLWAFWGPVRTEIQAAQPNAGHVAIAQWQQHAGEHDWLSGAPGRGTMPP